MRFSKLQQVTSTVLLSAFFVTSLPPGARAEEARLDPLSRS